MQTAKSLNRMAVNDEKGATPFPDPQAQCPEESQTVLELAFHMTGVQAYLDYYQL